MGTCLWMLVLGGTGDDGDDAPEWLIRMERIHQLTVPNDDTMRNQQVSPATRATSAATRVASARATARSGSSSSVRG